jgi:hypothetical protein
VTNLILLACLTTMLFYLTKSAANQFTATIVCAAFLSIFSFSQYLDVGNYNFITPYSHEATHGIMFSFAMICLLGKYVKVRSVIYLFLAGLCYGFIVLTKIDIFPGASAVFVCWLLLEIYMDKKNRLKTFQYLGLFILGALFPLTVFGLYFMTEMPAIVSLKAIFGQFIVLFTTGIADNLFYQRILGLTDVSANILRMLISFIVLVGGLAAIVRLNIIYKPSRTGLLLKIVHFTVLILVVVFLYWFPWTRIGYSLPLITFSILVFLMLQFVRNFQSNSESALKLIPLLLWTVFSFFLLAKIFLNTTVFHYGFYLAMPSFLVFIIYVVYFLPRYISERFKTSGTTVRYVAVGLIFVWVLQFLDHSNFMYKQKIFPIAENGDKILVFSPEIDPRAELVSRFLTRVDEIISPQSTFVVIPEGVMLNYLTRRENPTPFTNFMLPELNAWGENNILNGFKLASPDFILLMHRNTAEYGVGFFGQDAGYGKKILDWINRHYTPLLLIGHEPLRDSNYGLKILKRNHNSK